MKNALTLLFLISGIISFAQEKAYYDSTTNALGKNYHLYVGQTIIVKPKPKGLSKATYSGFYKGNNPKSTFNNSYYGDRLGFTPEDSLKFKRMKVIKTIPSFVEGLVSLVMTMENGDTITYSYSTIESEFMLPFVTEGFLKKQTDILKNSCMVIKSYLIQDSSLINVDVPYWYCTSVGLSHEKGGVVLKLENMSKNKIEVSYDALFTFGKGFYSCEEYNKLIKKHGAKFADNLIYSQVNIGMKRSICAIILGDPKNSNWAVSGSQSAEVWTIGNKVYYFTNNRLSSIQ